MEVEENISQIIHRQIMADEEITTKSGSTVRKPKFLDKYNVYSTYCSLISVENLHMKMQ